MIDKQQAIEVIIDNREDVILNSTCKKDAEHEGIILLDKYSTIDNEGYLQYRLRYLLNNYEEIKKETEEYIYSTKRLH